MDESLRVVTTPADEALFAFDAQNNVQPPRAIAEKIAWRYGMGKTHPIVDTISHAVEDAMDIGGRRTKVLLEWDGVKFVPLPHRPAYGPCPREYRGMSYEQASREAERLVERGWFRNFTGLAHLRDIMRQYLAARDIQS